MTSRVVFRFVELTGQRPALRSEENYQKYAGRKRTSPSTPSNKNLIKIKLIFSISSLRREEGKKRKRKKDLYKYFLAKKFLDEFSLKLSSTSWLILHVMRCTTRPCIRATVFLSLSPSRARVYLCTSRSKVRVRERERESERGRRNPTLSLSSSFSLYPLFHGT